MAETAQALHETIQMISRTSVNAQLIEVPSKLLD